MNLTLRGEPVDPRKGILINAENIALLPANVRMQGFGDSLGTAVANEYLLSEFVNRAKPLYDFILIDCSPSLGVLTRNALVAADSVLIPFMPDYFAMQGLVVMLRMIKAMRLDDAICRPFRAEDDVVRVEHGANVLGVADRDRRLDDDRRLDRSLRRRFLDQRDHGLDRRAVEEVLLRIIVGRRGDDDVIRIAVRSFAVGRGGQAQFPLAFSGFGKELFDIFVLNRGKEAIQLFDLFGNNVDRGHVVVLRKQNRQRQTDIAGAGNRDPIGACGRRRRGLPGGKHFAQLKLQRVGQRAKLIDGRREFFVLKTRQQRPVDAGRRGKFRLRDAQCGALPLDRLGKKLGRQFHEDHPFIKTLLLIKTIAKMRRCIATMKLYHRMVLPSIAKRRTQQTVQCFPQGNTNCPECS